MGMHAGNVIHEPHLPPRDKKVKHLRPRAKQDGKALDRVHLALKSAENSAKLKPVNYSTNEKLTSRSTLMIQWDGLLRVTYCRLIHNAKEILVSYSTDRISCVDEAERKYNQSSKDERGAFDRETDQ